MISNILIVDDEQSIRDSMKEILENENYKIDVAIDGIDCLNKLKIKTYNVVILDIKMPKMDGMETLERMQVLFPDIPVIMISGHANIDTAIDSVKKGAFDFVSKPPDLNRLSLTIKNAIEYNWERSKNITYSKGGMEIHPTISIETPKEFVVPFQQFLLYFKEYLLNIKGIEISYSIDETDKGVIIYFKKQRKISKINIFLNEFIDLSNLANIEIEHLADIELEEYESDTIKYELEKQIRFYQESLNWIKTKNSLLSLRKVSVIPQSIKIDFYNNSRIKTLSKNNLLKMKEAIGIGKTLEVLQELIVITKYHDNKDVVNNLLVIQSELSKLIKDSGLGKITLEYEQRKRNDIHSRLLELLDQLQLSLNKTIDKPQTMFPDKKTDLSNSIISHDESKEESPNIKSNYSYLNGSHILLADDNKLNHLRIKDLLIASGANVLTVNNGIEAVKLVKERQIDLLLIDVQLPEMDGYRATAMIRKFPEAQKRDIPIIALTASKNLTEKEKAKLFGMNTYLGKPFSSKEVLGEINNVLRIYKGDY